jgi:hypothetical protein
LQFITAATSTKMLIKQIKQQLACEGQQISTRNRMSRASKRRVAAAAELYEVVKVPSGVLQCRNDSCPSPSDSLFVM